MAILLTLIIICCVLLVLVVLVQNPKGGGLSQNFGGLSNQVLGVQRTTDFLEKGTWYLAIAICALSLMTVFVVPKRVAEGKMPTPSAKGLQIPSGSTQAAPPPPAAGQQTPGAPTGKPVQ